MADDVLERRTVEEGTGQHVKCVEPAARLVDVFDDEVGREVILEPLGIVERVVDLGEGHRPGLEPAVEDLVDAAHHRLTGGVVGIGADEVVDARPM